MFKVSGKGQAQVVRGQAREYLMPDSLVVLRGQFQGPDRAEGRLQKVDDELVTSLANLGCLRERFLFLIRRETSCQIDEDPAHRFLLAGHFFRGRPEDLR